jgi:hypothetical protein
MVKPTTITILSRISKNITKLKAMDFSIIERTIHSGQQLLDRTAVVPQASTRLS